jgi:hypothetical protein
MHYFIELLIILHGKPAEGRYYIFIKEILFGTSMLEIAKEGKQ